MTTPNNLTLATPESRPVARHFKVGSVATRNEVSADGRRRFFFPHGQADPDLATLAGWSELVDAAFSTPDHGCLILPTTTRPAGSVMSGMQAWPTEKEEVVAFMASYVRAVHDAHGGVDTSMTLDTIGVSRGNEDKFVLPPHTLETDPEAMRTWVERLDHDLTQVLAQEEARDHLMGMFIDATSFARGEA